MKAPVLLFVSAMMLVGCSSNEHEDLRQWMAEASQNIKGRIPPLPEVRPYEPVPYDAGNLIEPFKPGKIGVETKKTGGGLRPDLDRPREPLEAYPLESLRFVGVMVRKNIPYGLVQADGALYQVRTGRYMGQNYGVIVRISEAEIVVKELVQDPVGDWVEKESSLQLQNQEVRK